MSNAQRNRNLLAKFKQSVRSVIRCTNATPIRGHWGIGYACMYCKYQNPAASELKKHTLTTHSKDVSELDNLKYVTDMIIKLDITELKCKLCDRECDTLEEIMNHIKYVHKQPLYFDTTNHIVPFKFGKEDLTCAFCDKPFNNFKHLYEHMNEHFPNYTCKSCNRVFINKRSVRTHAIRHQKGTFVCSFCSKIFDTRIKMKEHERVLHLNASKTRKCGYCDKKFMDVVKKAEHEVKEHGAPVQKFACKACDKCFESQRYLNNHMNHFHLQLRPHKCPECDKAFYNKNEMKRHKVKHTKIKEYQCAICSKFYATRGSLTHHTKIHNSGRSYTCEKCGETFIQKNVWSNHMMNHEESQEALEALI